MAARAPKKHRRPTIEDVARMAGMGVMTVSRVANGHPSVSPATRKKILAAIEKVGYMPNEAARLLKGGRARTIGLIRWRTADVQTLRPFS